MTKKHFEQGKTLRGLAAERRHVFDWDLGRGLGLFCRRCGLPKQPFTADETECIGRTLATEEDLRQAREASIPSYLLSIAWLRQHREMGTLFDPGMTKALEASFKAPLVRFGMEVAQLQVVQVDRDAKDIYESVPADTNSFRHHMGCCLVAVKLCNTGDLSYDNQAVLMSIALIREADSPDAVGNYSVRTSQQMAVTMIQAARGMGYYGGRATSLRPH